MENWLVPEKDWMSLQYLVSESKEVVTDDRDKPKEHKTQLEGIPTGTIWSSKQVMIEMDQKVPNTIARHVMPSI